MDSVIIGTIIGGVGTAIGGIIAAVQRARSAAVEAAEKAVGVVQGAMEVQTKTVEDLQTQVTDQDKRITDINTQYTVAIGHIAEREDSAEEHMEERPEWLPVVPELIKPDVEQARESRKFFTKPRRSLEKKILERMKSSMGWDAYRTSEILSV